MLLLGGAGCRPTAKSESHDHADEAKTAQITVWMDGYEVFAEYRAPVVNKATTFITHVTDLRSIEPRTNGMVKFILRQGDAVFEHPQSAPARAGIYLPGIIFPKAGDWQLTLAIPAGGTNATVEMGKVTVYADEDSAAHAEMPEPPEGISFLKEQQWKILAGTEPVTKRKLVEQLRLPAMVAARPGSLAQVTPPVAGRLVLPPGKSMPVVGEKVEAGQVLALIQPSFSEVGARFVEAEGEVVRSKLALEQADLALKRMEKLAKAEAKSGRELQEAEFALKTAQAKYDAALALQATYRQASTNLGGQSAAARASRPSSCGRPSPGPSSTSRAPRSANTSRRRKPCSRCWTRQRLHRSACPRSQRQAPRRDEGGQLRSAGGDRDGSFPSPATAAGRLVFVGMQVDAATRTVPLIYEVKNPENRLRVGQSVNLFVETARAEETLAIPSAAIVEEDGRPIAFVQVGGETFQKRDLTLGIRDGNWVQVLSGITEGERVVTKGAYAVRLASVSSAIPAHGHVH